MNCCRIHGLCFDMGRRRTNVSVSWLVERGRSVMLPRLASSMPTGLRMNFLPGLSFVAEARASKTSGCDVTSYVSGTVSLSALVCWMKVDFSCSVEVVGTSNWMHAQLRPLLRGIWSKASFTIASSTALATPEHETHRSTCSSLTILQMSPTVSKARLYVRQPFFHGVQAAHAPTSKSAATTRCPHSQNARASVRPLVMPTPVTRTVRCLKNGLERHWVRWKRAPVSVNGENGRK
ncbi:hypothetical protein N8I77_007579 [Diaporthe amygdali]|uniref:Uncharacterized protein n=1 Tax=Phomopsis amygdali TaxID=1214568 RepID=A0AAD9SC92_PHOAM|nr:hypothetical protein N8I77_007579 [Diaporthe amygdali]